MMTSKWQDVFVRSCFRMTTLQGWSAYSKMLQVLSDLYLHNKIRVVDLFFHTIIDFMRKLYRLDYSFNIIRWLLPPLSSCGSALSYNGQMD